ncbi:Tetratricopeptide-like helical domain containing protein [Trema orientale]|uniref:Tetratricopeptide-like helical domain containing protein n=1 Tax=Trema orientale TaxID=63057 RepID=A0A2P5FET8_TREOI|nr:Tetratricopeptide-like helical domain containing protein [Trema orientale]
MSASCEALPRTKHFVTKQLNNIVSSRSLTRTKQLHAHTITSGLLSSSLCSNFAKSYALCGHVLYARKLFDGLSDRNSLLYNAVIRMYTQKGMHYDGLKVFTEMTTAGQCLPDNFTYPFVAKACGELSLLDVGVVVHGRALVAGFESDTYVQNSLLAMYMNCGDKEAARRVFEAMKERTVVSWNTMINGYFRIGCAEEALMMFDWMVKVGVEPDCATVVSVLPACGCTKNLELGREVHALVEEKGLGQKNITASNALVDMYAKCGKMDEARLLFDKRSKRDVVTWTTMINGYILNGDARSGLELFGLMHHDGVRPNVVTIALLLSACASLSLSTHGRCFHGWALRQKLESDVMVETALIDMYAKCKDMDHSLRVFARTSRKRMAPWSAIISGCSYNGLAREAIELFKQMLMEAIQPHEATVNGLLPAYSILADFRPAADIHCYLIRSGFLSSVEVATSLIDVYSKCGSLESAHKMFSEIPNKEKDIIAWSVIIAGYGMHGQGEAAVSLFNEMVQSGVRPNEVTFTSVLHACSHAGLVDEGLHLFKSMFESKQVIPQTDHYTCIIDLLGRSGRLEEAYDLIKSMTFMPNHAIWGALLGACVIHENVEIGEIAAKQLFELEPENTGNYVLMAKIYAAVGRWKDAENLRRIMGEIGLRKSPAHSLIEVRNM